MPFAPGLRTMISADARAFPAARSRNRSELYRSTVFVTVNGWNVTLPAPAPVD